jgi:hypothetical protein
VKKGPALIEVNEKGDNENDGDAGNDTYGGKMLLEHTEDNASVLAVDYLENTGIEKGLARFSTSPDPCLT